MRDVNDDDPEQIRALVNSYLTQAVRPLDDLQAAIDTNSGDPKKPGNIWDVPAFF
jgi:hypothetical protein